MQPEPSSASLGERLLIAYARGFPVRRGKLRLVNSMWKAVSATRGPWRTARLSHGDFHMTCDLRDMLQRQFYFFGTYFLEQDILRCWSEQAKGSRIVFDVGANAGIYSLAAIAAERLSTVHAFEPTPEIAQGLRSTARANNLHQLHVHEVAVYSADTDAVLRRFRGETGDNEGMNFITVGSSDRTVERVTAVRLDRFCADHGIDQIDLIKIDIQGQEAAALEGAERLLAEARIGTLFMELNWGTTGTELSPATRSIGLLEKAGYVFARPEARLVWRAAGEWLRGLTDVVATKPGAKGVFR